MNEEMHPASTEAYDLPERVRTYDADMDIMHPLRGKMIDIALETLPFEPAQPLEALDLGIGTGVFAKRLLENWPAARVVGVDGAAAMLDLARLRLGALATRVEWVVANFQDMSATLLSPERYDVVISAYALHHLDAVEKLAVLKSVVSALKPGGWFLNADLVVAGGQEVEQRIQQIRVKAVTARAPKGDPRFRTPQATREYLDQLETAEKDQPQTLDTDLRILREAGIAQGEVFWREYREVVIGGPKQEPKAGDSG